jgi:PAT family beta-lactamase induction signal transducer AmpG
MVMKMITPFLQDPRSAHGMGLTVAQIGTVFGTVGVCFLLLGGILGGFLVSKQGLKRWFWPATLLMNSTILLYFMLALFHPSSIVWIYIVNSLEQFGYGFGMASYTVFLLSTVKQEFKAAHYAVASALMAVGLMGPNMASGYLQQMLGYANFFLMSFFLTIPGMISIFFLPLWKKEDPEPAT